jgi:hypothetical protein
LLASKYGLFGKLRQLKPRLDRAVNLIIIGLAVIYVGQLVWWLVQGVLALRQKASRAISIVTTSRVTTRELDTWVFFQRHEHSPQNRAGNSIGCVGAHEVLRR